MASCATCHSFILFGGTRDGGLRFCGAACQAKGQLLTRAAQVSEGEARQHAHALHAGRCPKCSGPGPVDVHLSYRVWSALVLTQWQTRSQVSCRSCGVKAQVGNLALSAVAGWWGFPWGLLMTPVQITRNAWKLATPPDPAEPSPRLVQDARLQLAARSLVASAPSSASSPAPSSALTPG